jgi:hypothetical protein
MNEEFYAIIKLVSGEEVLSKVCAFEENNEVLIVLDNPVTVETTFVPKLGVPIAKVDPWIGLSQESTFIINRDKVITMVEVKDKTMVNLHKKYVREQTKTSNETKITEGMGYVSSTTEARQSLEKLYNSEAYEKRPE